MITPTTVAVDPKRKVDSSILSLTTGRLP